MLQLSVSINNMVWTTNLSDIPTLTMDGVEKWASKDCNIPRAVLLKGYSNWVEGYIHDVEGRFFFCIQLS